MYRIVLDGEWY